MTKKKKRKKKEKAKKRKKRKSEKNKNKKKNKNKNAIFTSFQEKSPKNTANYPRIQSLCFLLFGRMWSLFCFASDLEAIKQPDK
jgi:hypothetical protein